MQISWRRIAPNEIDHELIWLSVSLGSLGLAASWFALHLTWPVCLFHAITGHPCATCGATRSAIAFFHGQFGVAWVWNPLAFVVYSTLSIFNAYAFVVLISRTRRLRIAHLSAGEKNFMRTAAVILLAANWIYLLTANLPL